MIKNTILSLEFSVSFGDEEEKDLSRQEFSDLKGSKQHITTPLRMIDNFGHDKRSNLRLKAKNLRIAPKRRKSNDFLHSGLIRKLNVSIK